MADDRFTALETRLERIEKDLKNVEEFTDAVKFIGIMAGLGCIVLLVFMALRG